MYLDKRCAVARLQPTALDADKEGYATVGNYENIRINVQPATAELTAVSNGVYGRTFEAFVTVSGIKVSDRITMADSGRVYIVNGINDHMWGPIPHLQLVLFLGDN